MREFLKGVLILCLLTNGTVGAFAWYDDPPTERTWSIRIGGPVVALACLLVFLKLHFKRDCVPDFLSQTFGSYFEKGGLCFAFDTIVVSGICFFRAHFQNRYSRPCHARLALRPALASFRTHGESPHIEFDVDCPAAGYGVVCVPVAVRLEHQGALQKFDVGATVRYPEWRGRMLRFRDGGVVRTNANFGNPFGALLAIGGALTGSIVISTPASVTITMPTDVAESIPIDAMSVCQVLWELDGEYTSDAEQAML